MPIKFVCRCGKRLRAGNEMAARRVVCPRCGAPVGVPSLQPTVRGATLGPMSAAERLQNRQRSKERTTHLSPMGQSSFSNPEAFPTVTATEVTGPDCKLQIANCTMMGQSATANLQSATSKPLVLQVKRRYRWHLKEIETHWYQCLLYPLRAWPLVLGLASVLTLFSGGIALGLPGLLRDIRAEGSWLLAVCFPLPCLAIAFPIFAYASGFLDRALTSALTGEVKHIPWPVRDITQALKSGARWLVCFLAGPIVPAGASMLFWIHGGDLGLSDWLILAEAMVLAISLWFLLLLAVNQKDRLRDVHPALVVELIDRLGHRVLAFAVLASILALVHGWFVILALATVHLDAALGWFVLFLSWTSALFTATFLFRWTGIWFYWDALRTKRARILAQVNPMSNECATEQAALAQN